MPTVRHARMVYNAHMSLPPSLTHDLRPSIVVIAHNIRSTHNVGALLRTAEGLGVAMVYLTGYTPYPLVPDDTRLPHIAQKLASQIKKTALGAESTQPWRHADAIDPLLAALRADGYTLIGLEQTPHSQPLPAFATPARIALVLGSEVEGIDPAVIAVLDGCVEIPMFGQKESFNVIHAAAMALYHCRFMHHP